MKRVFFSNFYFAGIIIFFIISYAFSGKINSANEYLQEESTQDTGLYNIYELEGTYQGKDIIVINPFLIQYNSPVVREIILNDKTKLPEIKGTKILISLAKFKPGQYVNIKILHIKNFRPKVDDPKNILTPSTFEVVSASVDENSFKFTMTHETNQQPYYIEHFKYQKWVTVGKLISKGTPGNNSYVFQLNHHSGVNTYRIKQRDIVRGYHYTSQYEFESKKEPVKFNVAGNQIVFSSPTDYEIFEISGLIVKRGYGNSVDISDLTPQNYYLNMDNRLENLSFGTN